MARSIGDGIEGGGGNTTPTTVVASLATRVGAVYPRLKKTPYSKNNYGQVTFSDDYANLTDASGQNDCRVIVNVTLNDSGTGLVGYSLMPEFVPNAGFQSIEGYENSDDTFITNLTVTPYTSGYEIVGVPTYEVVSISDTSITVNITGSWTYNNVTYTGTTIVSIYTQNYEPLFTVGSPIYAPLTTIQ